MTDPPNTPRKINMELEVIHPWKRKVNKMIFQTFILKFYVNLPGFFATINFIPKVSLAPPSCYVHHHLPGSRRSSRRVWARRFLLRKTRMDIQKDGPWKGQLSLKQWAIFGIYLCWISGGCTPSGSSHILAPWRVIVPPENGLEDESS